MSATVGQFLDVARSQLGGYFPKRSPYGEWYGAKVGAVSTYAAAQFCAMGLSWCADQVGALDIIPMHAYTPSGVSAWKARGRWHPGVAGARAGDFVYFDFPGAPNRVSHVGVVESVNSDGSVNTIEFNSSGSAGGDQRNGRAVVRKRRKSYIVGYGRPAWAGAPSAPTPPPATARNADGSLTLELDGVIGRASIGRLQEVMGTPVDFELSKPSSTVIRHVQTYLNRSVAASHIRNLTGRTSLVVDGDLGPSTTKVLQFLLFNTWAPTVLGRPARASDFDGVLGRESGKLWQHALNRATAHSGRF